MHDVERALTVDIVAAVEVFDFGTVGNLLVGVQRACYYSLPLASLIHDLQVTKLCLVNLDT